MAIAHILSAITADTNADLRSLESHHAETMKMLETAHQKALADMRDDIARKKAERLQWLRTRAQGHVNMKKRHGLLRRKQELIDDVFDRAIDVIASLPEAKLRPLLQSWIAALPCTGVLHPAAPHAALIQSLKGPHTIGAIVPGSRGGFHFESERMDRDCTIEFLVQKILRPATEIDVSSRLFTA